MSKAFFDSMPSDIQKILIETAQESAVYERQVFEDRMAGGFQEAKKNGMTFLELEDREKCVDAVRPVWNDFGKNMPGAAELIQIIQRTA
jgi:TRAP-type C4-dicarboxylate transport system substrate-binding protein